MRANYEYHLDVFLPTGEPFKLLISLPEQFPMLPPVSPAAMLARTPASDRCLYLAPVLAWALVPDIHRRWRWQTAYRSQLLKHA